MVIYLLIVNITLLISFGLYHICFRKLTFFQWNRVYLLGSAVLSLLIPIGLFIDLSVFTSNEVDIPTIYLGDMEDVPIISVSAGSRPIYLMDIVSPIYFSGLLISLVILGYGLIQLRKAFVKKEAFMSFSFFNKVFLGTEVHDNKVIQSHEQVHVDQGHSYDIMMMEMIKLFNWFNPAVYWIIKELKFQHECIADEICSEDRVAYAELLVANAMRVDKGTLLNEFSNHSFLKKRIMMLFKNKSSNKKKVFYLSAIPVLFVVVGSTLVFNTSKARAIVEDVSYKIEDVTLASQSELSKAGEEAVVVNSPLVDENIQILAENDSNKNLNSNEATTATPPGGFNAFRKWVAENYQYPEAAIDAGVKGTIELSFFVESDGSLSDLKVIRDLSYGTGRAAIEVLKKSPKWTPGTENGKKVRSAFSFPIRLDLSDSKVEPENNLQRDTTKNKGIISSKSGKKQDGVKDSDEISDFNSIEIQPEYPGGVATFRKWVMENYQYPKAAIDAEVKGVVNATFIIERDGSISNISITRDLGHGTGHNLIAIIKKSKKWKPGIQNGRPVRTQFVLPLRLDLTKG